MKATHKWMHQRHKFISAIGHQWKQLGTYRHAHLWPPPVSSDIICEQPQYTVKVNQPDSCTVATLQVGERNWPLVELPSQKVLGRLQAYHATRPRKSTQMNWVIKLELELWFSQRLRRLRSHSTKYRHNFSLLEIEEVESDESGHSFSFRRAITVSL